MLSSTWINNTEDVNKIIAVEYPIRILKSPGTIVPGLFSIQRWNTIVTVKSLCGQRWIRTTEGVSQQIYSLPHLATLVFALVLTAKIRLIFVAAKKSQSFLLR